jgi:hypothetical protein
VTQQKVGLSGCPLLRHPATMFLVTEAVADTIRSAYEQGGELSAAIELRRLFPGVTDNAKARQCARTIAGWKPLSASACQITRLRPRWARPMKP